MSIDDDDLLRRVRAARVYEVARESELESAAGLSQRLGNHVLLKREDYQRVFSFKLRGAYNKMVNLDAQQRERGVITASAGNHAQGVALAAAELGIHALVVMPLTAPQVKVDAVRGIGGDMVEVRLVGDSYSDAQAHAVTLQQAQGRTVVHPFDDLDVIAGQATVGMEILRQHPAPIHAIFVPVGGGGLLAGVAACIKQLRPETRVIGVQSVESDAMARSLEAGQRIMLDEVGLFCDGTAVKQVGAHTFELCQRHVDAMIRVDADAICAAIKDVFVDTRRVLEPSGALALAGLKQYVAEHDLREQTLVAICSGANVNFERLRFVAERADMGEQREALFAVTLPEERGSFLRLCDALGDRSVTEFNYRIGDAREAHVLIGVRIDGPAEGQRLSYTLQSQGFGVLDLSGDELAKLHLRHMVGGRSPLASDERLYRFEFPERPGALMRFLRHLHPDWNVSLFHYRHQGGDSGQILVGLQVPPHERALLHQFLATLGYTHRDESDHPAYRLLLDSRSVAK